MSVKIGFDNDKYISMQSSHIEERIAKFGNKLYLEIGGSMFEVSTDCKRCRMIVSGPLKKEDIPVRPV